MSAVRGDITGLRSLNKRIRGLGSQYSTQLAIKVARVAKGALNYYLQSSFDAGENVYGDLRPTSEAKASYYYSPEHRKKWKMGSRGKRGGGGGASANRYSPGAAMSLVQSGVTRSSLRFVAVGTIVRVALGTKYAKYLIGKYKILPSGNAPIPAKWRESLEKVIARVIREQLGAA